ncbi:synaptic vesicle glycoprotein 2C [Plutella xylostella]|uniref:synaptic vesicle glycoprotein 2C n=1 Tax=Plutella xylostella TaxID=51655 RepID=UPI0020323765|nr:synaptic vesicle glycoprotein 2C [Plutella xylostella]
MQDSMSTPSMSEEQACLVRPRSDSDNSSKLGSFGSIARTMAYTEAIDGAGEPGNPINAANPVAELNMDTNDSGELIDYDDANALDLFHEDAMRQAGFGLYQLRVFLAGGLGVMSCALELAAIPLILPQAEQELCILPHEKTWLMTISMLGVCGGAWAWGGVAALAGRRRALLSALAVHATFAAVAAFTPTYPTNMMARFCSAIGSGGVLPAAYTYVAESCPAARRGLLLPPLLLLAGAGGLYASAAAAALVHPQPAPSTTAHFSAWHKYLLLCTLPSLSALVCLIWTHESPAYLLSAGMQHAACNVYQSIHKSNQRCRCGAAAAAEFRRELALPAKPPAPPRAAALLYKSYMSIFSPAHRRTTFTLGGLLALTLSLQFYLSAYVPTTIQDIENEEFLLSTRHIDNETFLNQLYNKTIENIEYSNSTFINCTFRDMFLSHVTFSNCSFQDVVFSNIKTVYSVFVDSEFVNSSLIDTDITPTSGLIDCTLTGTVIRGVSPRCGRGGAARGAGGARGDATPHATLAAAVLQLLLPKIPTVWLSGCMVLLSGGMWLHSAEGLVIMEALYRFFITIISFRVYVAAVTAYPPGIRCTAFGVISSFAMATALLGREAGSRGGGAALASIVAAALSAAATLLPRLAPGIV